MNIFFQFNKIKKLTSSIEDIVKALKSSELLAVTEDNTKVFRKTPVQNNEDVEACTIYVEHIKSDTSHEWVSSVFSEFGKVVYVSIPKYIHNRLNKGFAFIEYEQPEEAKKALDYFETIGCKMSSQMAPEQLCSIATFSEPTSLKIENVEDAANEKDNEENKQSDKEVSNINKT